MSQLDALRDMAIADVAVTLGVNGCPACGAEQRGSKDKRLPYTIFNDGRAWACKRCKKGGTAISFSRYARPDSTWSSLFSALRVEVSHFSFNRTINAPKYYDDAARFYAHCGPLTDECAEYLKRRNINPDNAGRCARSLMPPTEKNTHEHRLWWKRGYRLVFPLRDINGDIRNIKLRNIWNNNGPKSIQPKGFSVERLVVSSNERMPDDEPSRVWIVEGEIDLLTLADAMHTPLMNPIILGIYQGSWTNGHADRIPDGSTISIWTHHDKQGDAYAEHIANTFRGRTVSLRRSVPRPKRSGR